MVTWVNNSANRQLVIGLAPYKMIDGTNDWETSVVTDQIEKVRAQKGTSGVCFFRADHVIGAESKITALYNALQNEYFKYPAHIVPMDYNGITTPNAPQNVTQEYIDGKYIISWDAPDADTDNTEIKYYSVYLSNGTSVDINNLENIVAHIVKDTQFTYSSTNPNLKFAITAFDKNYYESAPIISSTSGIENILTAQDKFYYANGSLHIEASKPINHVEVYSISGSYLKHEAVLGTQTTINCNMLPSGVYITRTLMNDGSSFVNKFIR